MDFSKCIQCGVEIEGKGIHYQGRSFCSDECCEEFDEKFVASVEPKMDELDGDDFEDEDLAEEDLGYRDGEYTDGDDLLDDDYDIKPDDF